MADRVTLSEREHPKYEDNIDCWNLYLDSASGGDDFLNDDNLFSHRLEDSEDYEDRLDRGYYLNYCDTIPTLYNSFIFRSNIERPPDENLKNFRLNTDGRGTDISSFIKKMGYFASVFGVMHVLVTTPYVNKKNLSKADERELNIAPYCIPIYPTKLKDWSLDKFGNFRWVVIESNYYRDADPTVERMKETHYKLITRNEWKVEDEDGNLVYYEDGSEAKGKNTLGTVPIITMYHKDMTDDKIGKSLLKDIVYVNRTVMNWCSCVDEMIERQTFSQLVIPDDGSLAEESETGDDPLYRISTSMAWTANSESRWPPQFISPDVENITTIWKLVLDHVKEMFRMSGLVGTSDDLYASRSGRAAQVGFMGVNSSLAEKASKYQRFENEISKLAYRQLGLKENSFKDVKYPDSFDVTSLSEEIDTYFKIMERNFSPLLNKNIQKAIARRSTPLAPPDIRKEIEEEIDKGSGIVEQLTSNKDYDSMDDGNPNVQNLKDTFRRSQDKEDDEIKKQKKE